MRLIKKLIIKKQSHTEDLVRGYPGELSEKLCESAPRLPQSRCSFAMTLHGKQSAMFGLDARIALAIFGALSVITGAALYSAIQNAKATAFLAQSQEVAKAIEQYYLDTGSILPQSDPESVGNTFYRLQGNALITKPAGVTGWKGPYIKATDLNGYSINFAKCQLSFWIYEDGDGEWGGAKVPWNDGLCVNDGRPCSITVGFNDNKFDLSMAQKIDQMVDGGDGDSNGRYRWHADRYHIFKVIPARHP